MDTQNYLIKSWMARVILIMKTMIKLLPMLLLVEARCAHVIVYVLILHLIKVESLQREKKILKKTDVGYHSNAIKDI